MYDLWQQFLSSMQNPAMPFDPKTVRSWMGNTQPQMQTSGTWNAPQTGNFESVLGGNPQAQAQNQAMQMMSGGQGQGQFGNFEALLGGNPGNPVKTKLNPQEKRDKQLEWMKQHGYKVGETEPVTQTQPGNSTLAAGGGSNITQEERDRIGTAARDGTGPRFGGGPPPGGVSAQPGGQPRTQAEIALRRRGASRPGIPMADGTLPWNVQY